VSPEADAEKKKSLAQRIFGIFGSSKQDSGASKPATGPPQR
jgi:hypothetical protein